MIEYADVDQRQRFRQSPRQNAVGLAGFSHAAGMIVGEDERSGVVGLSVAPAPRGTL